MKTKEGKVTASVEEIGHYNMLLTEAIYELLADKRIFSEKEAGAGTNTQGGNNCEFLTGSVRLRWPMPSWNSPQGLLGSNHVDGTMADARNWPSDVATVDT